MIVKKINSDRINRNLLKIMENNNICGIIDFEIKDDTINYKTKDYNSIMDKYNDCVVEFNLLENILQISKKIIELESYMIHLENVILDPDYIFINDREEISFLLDVCEERNIEFNNFIYMLIYKLPQIDKKKSSELIELCRYIKETNPEKDGIVNWIENLRKLNISKTDEENLKKNKLRKKILEKIFKKNRTLS